ncbi:MAG: hypothetical protein ACLPX9_10550 [Rhodomicrobium sp.]
MVNSKQRLFMRFQCLISQYRDRWLLERFFLGGASGEEEGQARGDELAEYMGLRALKKCRRHSKQERLFTGKYRRGGFRKPERAGHGK